MKSVGICATKPIRAAIAPWNQAQARASALAFLHVLPDLLLADQLHEAADQRLGGARDRLAGDRVLAEDGFQQVVAARALGQLRERIEDRVLDELDDADDQPLGEADEPVDRAR